MDGMTAPVSEDGEEPIWIARVEKPSPSCWGGFETCWPVVCDADAEWPLLDARCPLVCTPFEIV